MENINWNENVILIEKVKLGNEIFLHFILRAARDVMLNQYYSKREINIILKHWLFMNF